MPSKKKLGFPNPKNGQHSRLTLEEAITQYDDGLLTAAGLLYHAVKIYRASGQPLRINDVSDFYEKLTLPKRTFYRAKAEVAPKGYLDEEVYGSSEYSDTERQIQNRLQAELGGQIEVTTVVGRIDLLTESEVIEIKDISDWKEALGKILAYSAFFPTHRRIHLFGKPDLAKLALAQGTCSEFNIAVTFEEVQ